MRTKFFTKATSIVLFVFIALSCAPRRDIVYYQNIENLPSGKFDIDYEIKIQPDDLLSIIVSADNPEVAQPFNLQTSSITSPSRPELVRSQETLMPL